jgi:anti-sigma factor RsiW
VSHPRQQLSALIDGELDPSERDRVLIHVTGCAACQEEVAALRMLKRRMSTLGEAAAGAAFAELTWRLSQLSQAPDQSRPAGAEAPSDSRWHADHPARQWPFPAQSGKSEQRAGRYFLGGSLVLFMVGLSTAAVIAGGEPQPNAPAPPTVPSVDVMVVPHEVINGLAPSRRPDPQPSALDAPLVGSFANR